MSRWGAPILRACLCSYYSAKEQVMGGSRAVKPHAGEAANECA
jgi:hypothetical protein